jgi:ethanolamine utilization protein EutN
VYLAVVVGKIFSTEKLDAYEKRKLLLVRRLSLDGKPAAAATVAVDYVDAGEGDTVLVGAAPGLASTVFGIPNAPIRELVMGVVDRVNPPSPHKPFGNTVAQ